MCYQCFSSLRTPRSSLCVLCINLSLPIPSHRAHQITQRRHFPFIFIIMPLDRPLGIRPLYVSPHPSRKENVKVFLMPGGKLPLWNTRCGRVPHAPNLRVGLGALDSTSYRHILPTPQPVSFPPLSCILPLLHARGNRTALFLSVAGLSACIQPVLTLNREGFQCTTYPVEVFGFTRDHRLCKFSLSPWSLPSHYFNSVAKLNLPPDHHPHPM
jgi:hypothetical protein